MAKAVWQVQEAKDKLSEIVAAALSKGPQTIFRDSEKVAVVLSYADYRKMEAGQLKLSAFFRQSPLVGIELNLTRDALGEKEGSG